MLFKVAQNYSYVASMYNIAINNAAASQLNNND